MTSFYSFQLITITELNSKFSSNSSSSSNPLKRVELKHLCSKLKLELKLHTVQQALKKFNRKCREAIIIFQVYQNC